jgi:hypothetical protein
VAHHGGQDPGWSEEGRGADKYRSKNSLDKCFDQERGPIESRLMAAENQSRARPCLGMGKKSKRKNIFAALVRSKGKASETFQYMMAIWQPN